ncbi:MAG: spermidine/putrescine ABC transporter substrate-binding protein, partial [Pseudomonadota bacterium]
MTQLKSILLGTSVLTLAASTLAAEGELNALVWCDHTDPALIEPFEAAHDVKVNLREYEGTGA